MTDDYKIIYQIDKKCEKDLNKHDIKYDKYTSKIIDYAVVFFETGVEPHTYKLSPAIQDRLYFETTMYIMKLGLKEHALVTIDADEVFDQLIITLWAFTSNHDFEKTFRGMAESAYQKFLNQGGAYDE
ncbi:MAG: hypothetical protein E7296_06055 [Lachnospiraceae bacterium]|nr:hypothetical protein [Lachnospiraceae bacterium]